MLQPEFFSADCPQKGTQKFYEWIIDKFSNEEYGTNIHELRRSGLLRLRAFDSFCRNPDFYVVGLVLGFLGLEWLDKYIIQLSTDVAKRPFRLGVCDIKSGNYKMCDFASELFMARTTAPDIFDAAIIRMYGDDKSKSIIEDVIGVGCGKVLAGSISKERTSKIYAQLCGNFARSL